MNEDNLKVLHESTPFIPNAQYNRKMAIKCFEAGKTPQQIAERYPKVFKCVEGKLAQIYDSIYKDTGIKETKYTILESDVKQFLKG